MKVFIQSSKKYLPCNYNFFNAYQGFYEMGFETVFFHTYDELKASHKEDVVVGYVDTVRNRLYDFGITTPEIDYPKELYPFLKRKIWTSNINTINSRPELWPVFVKPIEDKKFTGVVVRSPKDLIGCGDSAENTEVLCSEVINLLAEWRVFVRYGKILGVRFYRGDWHYHFDGSVIDEAVAKFSSAPSGYAIDFGVTDKGETVLIEVNDGYALGCYGLLYIDYAKLLSARWTELTETVDECDF